MNFHLIIVWTFGSLKFQLLPIFPESFIFLHAKFGLHIHHFLNLSNDSIYQTRRTVKQNIDMLCLKKYLNFRLEQEKAESIFLQNFCYDFGSSWSQDHIEAFAKIPIPVALFSVE